MDFPAIVMSKLPRLGALVGISRNYLAMHWCQGHLETKKQMGGKGKGKGNRKCVPIFCEVKKMVSQFFG